jgi:LmbE family N-acetylglucosaminyl deacetylase
MKKIIILILCIVVVLSILFINFIRPNTGFNPEILTSQVLLNDLQSGKSIMWIDAHPDDELAVAGTLALACQNKRIDCWIICIGSLENVVSTIAGKTDQEVRIDRNETIEWMKKNYLKDYILLGNRFSAVTDKEKIKPQLKQKIEELRPDILLVFTPYGYSNNKNHQDVSDMVLDLVDELSYKPGVYMVVNDDTIIKRQREYLKYPPTDLIPLTINLLDGRTAWDAKLEIWENYRSSVGLAESLLSDAIKLKTVARFELFKKFG